MSGVLAVHRLGELVELALDVVAPARGEQEDGAGDPGVLVAAQQLVVLARRQLQADGDRIAAGLLAEALEFLDASGP